MKKLITHAILILVFVFAAENILAQSTTNVPALLNLADEFSAQWNANQLKVEQYAAENNVPIYEVQKNGKVIQLVDVVDGKPVYYVTFNLGAAHTTRAFQLWEV